MTNNEDIIKLQKGSKYDVLAFLALNVMSFPFFFDNLINATVENAGPKRKIDLFVSKLEALEQSLRYQSSAIRTFQPATPIIGLVGDVADIDARAVNISAQNDDDNDEVVTERGDDSQEVGDDMVVGGLIDSREGNDDLDADTAVVDEGYFEDEGFLEEEEEEEDEEEEEEEGGEEGDGRSFESDSDFIDHV